MKHFTMAELTRSATARAKGLDNTPTAEHRSNIEMSVAQLLDPLREAWAVKCANEQWGTPAIRVSSGYRGFALNKAVGGSATSAHCVGFAFDLVPDQRPAGRLQALLPYVAQGPRLRPDDLGGRGCRRHAPLGAYRLQEPPGWQRRQLLTMRAGKYIPMTA